MPATLCVVSSAPCAQWRGLSHLSRLAIPFAMAEIAPPAFQNRLSRSFPLSPPSQALPSPIQRILSRPRWAALRLALGRAGHAAGGGAKRPFEFPIRYMTYDRVGYA